MKYSKLAQLSILISCLSSVSAFANHNDDGGEAAEKLKFDAQELNNRVRYSNLRYTVKMAVAHFAASANQLGNSIQVESNEPETIHAMNHVDQGYFFQLQQLQQTWVPVESYLFDTYSDFPQVFRAYQQTRQDLYVVLNDRD